MPDLYTDLYNTAWVETGLTVSASSGLIVNIAPGTAYIPSITGSARHDFGGGSVTIPAVAGIWFVDWNGGSFATPSGGAPYGYVRLASVTTDGTSITGVVDLRPATNPATGAGYGSMGANVKTYGADPAGASYSDTAFANAQSDILASAAGSGALLIPPGTYKFQAPFSAHSKVSLRGCGRQTSILQFMGCSGITYTGTGFNESSYYLQFDDLGIQGDYTAGMHGFAISQSGFIDWNRVQVTGFGGNGFNLSNILMATLRLCRVKNNDGDGISLGDVCNNFVILGGESAGNNGYGINASGHNGPYIEVLDIGGIACEGNRLGGLQLSYVHGVTVHGCDFEVNGAPVTGTGRRTFSAPAVSVGIELGGATTNGAVQGCSIIGNKFSSQTPVGSSGTGYHINPILCQGVEISGNEFYPSATADVNPANLNGSAIDVHVSRANKFYNGTTSSGLDLHASTHGPDSTDPIIINGGNALANAFEPWPRWANGSALTLTSGTIYWSYLTASEALTLTKLRLQWSAAATTTTLCRMGLFTVDGSGNLAPVAETANDTTIATSGQEVSRSFDTSRGLAASVSAAYKTRYALGLIWVGTGSPTVRGVGMSLGGAANSSPRFSASLASQTDLPTTQVAVGSLANLATPPWLAVST